jgi:hypothetical protein
VNGTGAVDRAGLRMNEGFRAIRAGGEVKKEGKIMKTTKPKTIGEILTYFLLMVVIFLISACSHVVFPRGPIPVEMDIVGPIDTSKEISFVNRQTESKLTLIATQGAHKYFADFKQWTDLVVDQLESELKKRGVQVKPSGDYTFNVSVDNARIFWGTWAIRCIVNVRVEKSDGTWSKTFEGNNASPATLYRAIDGAVYRAVEAILKDSGFREAISQ